MTNIEHILLVGGIQVGLSNINQGFSIWLRVFDGFQHSSLQVIIHDKERISRCKLFFADRITCNVESGLAKSHAQMPGSYHIFQLGYQKLSMFVSIQWRPGNWTTYGTD